MKKPTKGYILWTSNGNGSYTPTEYDTVEEVLLVEKYSADWYITESINSVSAHTSFKESKAPTNTH